jgi:hypothetical protein
MLSLCAAASSIARVVMRRQLAQQERAVELLGGPPALAGEALDEDVPLGRKPARGDQPAHTAAELRRAEHRHVREPQRVDRELRVAQRPGREHAHHQEALHALRVLQRQQEADVPAPVVPRHGELADAQLVEHGEDVALQLVLLVAVARHAGPAKAAKVGRDHARVRRDERDHVAPR